MNKLYAAMVSLSLAWSTSTCSAQNAKIPFRQIEHDAQLYAANPMAADAEEGVSRSNAVYSFSPAFSGSAYMRPDYKQPRTLDSKFFLINGLHLGLAALDVGLTQHCLANHHCKEGNPLMPSSFAGQFAINSAFVSTAAFVSFRLKKQDSRMWWLSPVVGIGAHTAGAVTGILNR